MASMASQVEKYLFKSMYDKNLGNVVQIFIGNDHYGVTHKWILITKPKEK